MTTRLYFRRWRGFGWCVTVRTVVRHNEGEIVVTDTGYPLWWLPIVATIVVWWRG